MVSLLLVDYTLDTVHNPCKEIHQKWPIFDEHKMMVRTTHRHQIQTHIWSDLMKRFDNLFPVLYGRMPLICCGNFSCQVVCWRKIFSSMTMKTTMNVWSLKIYLNWLKPAQPGRILLGPVWHWMKIYCCYLNWFRLQQQEQLIRICSSLMLCYWI